MGYVAGNTPLIPQSVMSAGIAAILGLNTTTLWLPATVPPSRQAVSPSMTRPRSAALAPCSAAVNYASNRYYMLDQLGAAYGVDSLLSAGQTGRNQTVAVYELSPVSAGDLSAYESCFGLANSVSRVSVDGGGTVDPSGTEEADLDVEQIATQARAASIISYEGPQTVQGAYDTWGAIVAADAPAGESASSRQMTMALWARIARCFSKPQHRVRQSSPHLAILVRRAAFRTMESTRSSRLTIPRPIPG